MRDAGDRWINIDAAQAAGGVRIALQEPADILPGTTLRVIPDDPELVIDVESAARSERDAMDEAFDLVEEGVVIRADSIGGLEALFHELKGHDPCGAHPARRQTGRSVLWSLQPSGRSRSTSACAGAKA